MSVWIWSSFFFFCSCMEKMQRERCFLIACVSLFAFRTPTAAFNLNMNFHKLLMFVLLLLLLFILVLLFVVVFVLV